MSNFLISKNVIYNNKLIYFNLGRVESVIISNWLLFKNEKLNSAFHLNLKK